MHTIHCIYLFVLSAIVSLSYFPFSVFSLFVYSIYIICISLLHIGDLECMVILALIGTDPSVTQYDLQK
ncbi:hypothetical protein BDZ97DRAFT_1863053 [Flammula alnicola]|nr:hypothetical protein BDZ97DRAFT_1863053 [Flammula alnicola]